MTGRTVIPSRASVWLARASRGIGWVKLRGSGGDLQKGSGRVRHGFVLQVDQAEVAGDAEIGDFDGVDGSGFDFGFDVDAWQKADAKTGADEALHQLAALDLHDRPGIDVVHPEEIEQDVALTALFRQQECVPDDVFGTDGGQCCERMRLWNGKNKLVVVQRFDDEALVGDRKRDDT